MNSASQAATHATVQRDHAEVGTVSVTQSTLSVGAYRWYLERAGNGPACLLLHGTGASAHSWQKLLPLLATHHTVIAVDLPGHARNLSPPGTELSLPVMAGAVLELLEHCDLPSGPIIGVGHSAGAAILAEMALQKPSCLGQLISLNGALVPLNGLARLTFSPLARASANTQWLSSLFSRRVKDPAVLERLLKQTGSTLDVEGIQAYHALCQDPEHVSGALRMMAAWRLEHLYPKLHRLTLPVHLIAGARDRMIAPRDAYRLQRVINHSTLDVVENAGHLAHEETPVAIAQLILAYTTNTRDHYISHINEESTHATTSHA